MQITREYFQIADLYKISTPFYTNFQLQQNYGFKNLSDFM